MIGTRARWNDKTYEVTGLLFDVQYSYDGTEGQFQDLIGDMASTITDLSYQYDYQLRPPTDPLVAYQAVIEIQIKVYWKEVDDEPTDKTYKIKVAATWSNLVTVPYPGDMAPFYYYELSMPYYTVSFEFTITDKRFNNVPGYFFGYDGDFQTWAPATLTQSNGAPSASVVRTDMFSSARIEDVVNPSSLLSAVVGEIVYGVDGENDRLTMDLKNNSDIFPGTNDFMIHFNTCLRYNSVPDDFVDEILIDGLYFYSATDPEGDDWIELFDGNATTVTLMLAGPWLTTTEATVTVTEVK
jgi:hypothetical protein